MKTIYRVDINKNKSFFGMALKPKTIVTKFFENKDDAMHFWNLMSDMLEPLPRVTYTVYVWTVELNETFDDVLDEISE